MNDPAAAPADAPSLRPLDPEAVFALLSEPSRRRILARLFDRQSHQLSALGGTNRKHIDTIRKHLEVLIKAGLVTSERDPTNVRRHRYTLSPSVKTETTERGRTMDYGCCLVRL